MDIKSALNWKNHQEIKKRDKAYYLREGKWVKVRNHNMYLLH